MSHFFVDLCCCGLISNLAKSCTGHGQHYCKPFFKRILFSACRLASLFYLASFSEFAHVRSDWLLVDKHLCVLQSDSLSCRCICIIMETKTPLSQSVLESSLLASKGISVHFHSGELLYFFFTEVQHRNTHIIIPLMSHIAHICSITSIQMKSRQKKNKCMSV